jgi:hypothetical protein
MNLEKTDIFLLVIDSFISVSGLIFVFLKCPNGRIDSNTFLLDEAGVEWRIIDNDVELGGVSNKKIVEEKSKEYIFLYQLESKYVAPRPQIGQNLFMMKSSR